MNKAVLSTVHNLTFKAFEGSPDFIHLSLFSFGFSVE